MQIGRKNQSRSNWFLICFIGWLIINVRVEAGIGSSFERAVDGLVGGVILLVSIFFALRFFRCIGDACTKEGKCGRGQQSG